MASTSFRTPPSPWARPPRPTVPRRRRPPRTPQRASRRGTPRPSTAAAPNAARSAVCVDPATGNSRAPQPASSREIDANSSPDAVSSYTFPGTGCFTVRWRTTSALASSTCGGGSRWGVGRRSHGDADDVDNPGDGAAHDPRLRSSGDRPPGEQPECAQHPEHFRRPQRVAGVRRTRRRRCPRVRRAPLRSVHRARCSRSRACDRADGPRVGRRRARAGRAHGRRRARRADDAAGGDAARRGPRATSGRATSWW